MNILIRSMSSRAMRSEEHTSELQSLTNLVCRLLLEKKRGTRRRQEDPTELRPPAAGRGAERSVAPTLQTPRTLCGCGGLAVPTWCVVFFFFNDTATTEIYTLSLHDALPILPPAQLGQITGDPWADWALTGGG